MGGKLWALSHESSHPSPHPPNTHTHTQKHVRPGFQRRAGQLTPSPHPPKTHTQSHESSHPLTPSPNTHTHTHTAPGRAMRPTPGHLPQAQRRAPRPWPRGDQHRRAPASWEPRAGADRPAAAFRAPAARSTRPLPTPHPSRPAPLTPLALAPASPPARGHSPSWRPRNLTSGGGRRHPFLPVPVQPTVPLRPATAPGSVRDSGHHGSRESHGRARAEQSRETAPPGRTGRSRLAAAADLALRPGPTRAAPSGSGSGLAPPGRGEQCCGGEVQLRGLGAPSTSPSLLCRPQGFSLEGFCFFF